VKDHTALLELIPMLGDRVVILPQVEIVGISRVPLFDSSSLESK
jgi:hypothetical protein